MAHLRANRPERPSDRIEGRPRGLLRAIEKSDSNRVHGGLSRDGWRAAAVYVDGYVMCDFRSQRTVAEEFDTSIASISRRYREIVTHDSFDRVYGKILPLDGSIGAMLGRMRATEGMIGVRLGEGERSVRRRLADAKRNDDIREETFGGRTFYYTSP